MNTRVNLIFVYYKMLSKKTAYLYLVPLLLIGCNVKQYPKNNEALINSVYTQKINNWFKLQLADSVNNDLQQLTTIRRNLEINKLWVEDLQEIEKMIIVPIHKKFKTKWNNTETVSNYLLAFTDEKLEIRKVQILQYQDSLKTNQPQIQFNTLNSLYNSQFPTGTFTYFAVNNLTVPLVDVKHEKGEVFSYSIPISIASNSISNKPVNGKDCINWYWETTYFYSGGTNQSKRRLIFNSCDTNK